MHECACTGVPCVMGPSLQREVCAFVDEPRGTQPLGNQHSPEPLCQCVQPVASALRH
jgi:hypothetical protein